MISEPTTRGISVIVCCYNSSGRIVRTLNALQKQECNSETLWEIIIVDNGSTDNTSDIARAILNESNSKIKARIIFERQPGLGNARRKGANEAAYSVVLFCDDDNWLDPGYVQGVFDILTRNSEIAACGGMGVPVFEIEEPFWFYEYAESFALGSQQINNENGQILNLYGAGLAIQKHVLKELYNSGFEPILQDRVGKKLSSAGDTELTYAFVLMGYKLFCSDDLKFFHYLPKERLTFAYLKNLIVAFGGDGPIRNLYYAYISKRFFHKLIKYWSFHVILSLLRLVKYFIIPPKKYGRIIYFHWNISYIKQLIFLRKRYPALKKNILKIIDLKKYRVTEHLAKGAFSYEAQGS